MRVAIHQNHNIFYHSSTWDKEWINFCIQNDIDYEIVNCFENDILQKMKNFDILLWHFNQYSLQEMLFARTIINTVQRLGVKVFPDYNTTWHFDNKISETYLLNSIKAPVPKSWAFYTKESANVFFETCEYPIVAKLKSGSGASNVKLLKSKKEALSYTKIMFSNGFKSRPNVLFKAKSNFKSAKNINTIISRMKRIPDFIQSFRGASKLPNEKGYVYLQEFIPNDGYDLKVVVIGDKASFLARPVRENDFRASGGGTIFYDKSYINKEILDLAFEISDKLEFQSMGYDFVIDKRDNKPKIIEISYGFSHTSQMELGGFWTKDGQWVEEPLNAPQEILRRMLFDN